MQLCEIFSTTVFYLVAAVQTAASPVITVIVVTFLFYLVLLFRFNMMIRTGQIIMSAITVDLLNPSMVGQVIHARLVERGLLSPIKTAREENDIIQNFFLKQFTLLLKTVGINDVVSIRIQLYFVSTKILRQDSITSKRVYQRCKQKCWLVF